MTAPTKPGFYWAKWMIADNSVPENYTPYKIWEPVEVFVTGNELRVNIIGNDFSQPLDCFHWGAELVPPIDKTQAVRAATEADVLKAAAVRYRSMTHDEREAYIQAVRRGEISK